MSKETTTVTGTIKNILAKLLLGFLVITFAVWGIGDILNTGNEQTLATVGEKTISVREYQNERRFFEEQMRDQLPHAFLNSPLFQQQVVQRLIRNKLHLSVADDAGIYADEALIAQEVRTNPQFQNIRGTFDEDTYRRVLQSSRLTEARFLRILAEEATLDIVGETLNLEGIDPSDSWLAVTRMHAQEMRSADVISIILDQKETIPAPPESILRETYARDSTAYMQPESRDFSLAIINADIIESRAKKAITNEEVSNFLASQGLEDNVTTRAQAIKDLLPSFVEDEAYALSITLEDAIAGGATLKEAITSSGVDATLNEFKQVRATDFTSKLKQHASYLQEGFEMAEGDVSNLLTSTSGNFFLLQLDAITPSQPKPFAEVKATVTRNVLSAERNRRMRQKAEELMVRLRGANGTDARNAVLKDLNLKRQVVTLQRGNLDESNLSPYLHTAIFNAAIDDVLGPFGNDAGDAQQIAIVTSIQIPMPDQVKHSPQTDSNTVSLYQELVNDTLLSTMQEAYPVHIRMRLNNESTQ